MALPKLYLKPVRDNYAGVWGSTTKSTQLDGGAGRYRKDQMYATTLITVNWIIEGDDYDYLQAFYRTALDMGSLPFLMDLIMDSQGLLEYTVNIVDGSWQLTQQIGLAYYMQAQLEVVPLPVDVSSDMALIARNSY